jgi:hypothetical protein
MRTRGVWLGWPNRSLLIALDNLTVTPQIPSAHIASAAPTATSCTMLMTVVGCWWLHPTSVLTCMPLAYKKAIAAECAPGCCPNTVQYQAWYPVLKAHVQTV